MKLSATRLKTYLLCPRQYRYCYVDEVPRLSSAPLLFGSAMHETLLWLQERRIESGVLPGIAEGLAVFTHRWREVMSREQPPFKAGTSVESYEVAARQMLAVHLKVSRVALLPLLLEFPFEITVGEHQLVGILDRVDESEAGLVIVDYKSGSRKPSQSDIERDLQLTCYAYAAHQLFGLPVEKVVCHWLKDGVDLSSTRGEGDFHWLTEEIMPYVAAGVEAEAFAPKPGYWCRFCDFRELCLSEGISMEEVNTVAGSVGVEASQGGAAWLTPSK